MAGFDAADILFLLVDVNTKLDFPFFGDKDFVRSTYALKV
jgi:hypothetical protein